MAVLSVQEITTDGLNPLLVAADPAGESMLVSPFEPNRFNNSNGRVEVSYSDATSVTVAAIKI